MDHFRLTCRFRIQGQGAGTVGEKSDAAPPVQVLEAAVPPSEPAVQAPPLPTCSHEGSAPDTQALPSSGDASVAQEAAPPVAAKEEERDSLEGEAGPAKRARLVWMFLSPFSGEKLHLGPSCSKEDAPRLQRVFEAMSAILTMGRQIGSCCLGGP